MNRNLVTWVGTAAVTAAAWSAPEAQALDLLEPYASGTILFSAGGPLPIETAHRPIWTADFTDTTGWNLGSFAWITHKQATGFRPASGSEMDTDNAILKSNGPNSSALLDLNAVGVGGIDLSSQTVAITATVVFPVNSLVGFGFGNDVAFNFDTSSAGILGTRAITNYVRSSGTRGITWGTKRDFNNVADANALITGDFLAPKAATANYGFPVPTGGAGAAWETGVDVAMLIEPTATGYRVASFFRNPSTLNWTPLSGIEANNASHAPRYWAEIDGAFTTENLWIYGPSDSPWEIHNLVISTPTIMGDVTLDGVVDDDDLAVVQANLGGTGRWADGALTRSGNITLYDAYLLFQNYESTPAMTAIPEPASLSLLAIGSLLMIRRRPRVG